MFRPASQAAVGDLSAPERRRTSFAIIRLGVNLGMSVGPALGGVLIARAPVAMFVVDGATSVAAALVLFVWGNAGAHASATAEAEARPRATSPPAYRSPSALVFALAAFLFGCVFFQGDGALPIYLVEELGLPAAFFGITYSLNTALILAFELPLTSATSHWPHARTLVLGSLLGAAGFGGFALVHGPVGALAATAGWTFGEMMLFPALPAFIADAAPSDRIGEHMGLYNAAFALAFAAGPYFGLRALDRYGPTALWIGSSVCASLAALLFYAVARRARIATPVRSISAAAP